MKCWCFLVEEGWFPSEVFNFGQICGCWRACLRGLANLVVTPLCVVTGFVDIFPVVFTWLVEIFSGVVPTCLGFFGRVWSWVFVDFFLPVLLQRGLLRSLKNFFLVLLRGLWVLETFSSWYCYGVCRFFFWCCYNVSCQGVGEMVLGVVTTCFGSNWCQEYHTCCLLEQGFRSPSWHSVKGPLEAGLYWFCSGRSDCLLIVLLKSWSPMSALWDVLSLC